MKDMKRWRVFFDMLRDPDLGDDDENVYPEFTHVYADTPEEAGKLVEKLIVEKYGEGYFFGIDTVEPG